MSKSMFPHLEAIKGFALGRNGLISPGQGQKGPWLYRETVMRAAIADVLPLCTKIAKLQDKLATQQKGQHGKSTKRRNTTKDTAQAAQQAQKRRK